MLARGKAGSSSDELGVGMPWKPSDADRHKKGLSQDQKVKWARVANSVLKDEDDEGTAIRVANSRTHSGTSK